MRILPLLALTLAPTLVAAQATFSFGTGQDAGAPVEMAADRLSVSDDGARNVMEGNVVIAQGATRLSADRVEIDYDGGEITQLVATGDVILAQGEDVAEAQRADYALGEGTVVLTGDVLLTQGASVATAERARIDLESGAAVMEGRVRTVLRQP